MTDSANSLFLLAQDAAPAAGAGGFFGPQLLMIVLLFVMMYFLMIRPEQKRRKEQARKIASLKPGQAVVTVGGLHGRVSQVKDTTLILKIADSLKVEVDKVAVATVQEKPGSKAATSGTTSPAETGTRDDVVDAEVVEDKPRS